MLALALAKTVETCMTNHYYSFGGLIQKQSDGGAIGSDLTGEIARNVMTWWDTIFIAILKELSIKVDLYSRYVDDQLEALPPINPGWDFDTKSRTMVFSQEKADNDSDTPAIRTAKILQKKN